MIIVYNADERFSEVFATSVVSLLENNKDAEEITVYLIEDHISSENKDKFQQLFSAYGRSLVMLPMPDLEKIAGVSVAIPHYNRMATCGRLFIASLLPDTIDKVIYVDCDTMFLDSIAELWDMDISDYAVGMTDGAQNATFRTQIDLPKDGIYYNSGLLLINLKKWRETEAEKKFLNFIRSQGGYIPFPDEGVLNAVFDRDVRLLPLRYNAITLIYAFDYREMCYVRGIKHFYSPDEVDEAREHPVMVHFTNHFYLPVRPWMQGCEHPYQERYLEYRYLTPWKNESLWEDPRPPLKKLYTKFCHVLPKPIAIWTARMISLYLTPMKHRYKKWKGLCSMKKFAGGVQSFQIIFNCNCFYGTTTWYRFSGVTFRTEAA